MRRRNTMIKTLRIQLTNECNLKCRYCCHEGTANEYSILTDRNLINFIRASYEVLKIKRIKFTGGEPLEYDGSIFRIIHDVDREGIDYSIVTNATSYSGFMQLIENIPNIEFTISLPVPPENSCYSTYKSITGCIKRECFQNVISCIEYLINHKRRFKINYVLCNGINTSKVFLEAIIQFAMQNPTVQLRFLEMAVNSTNNRNGRIHQYIFTQDRFEKTITEIGFDYTKAEDKRSSCLYNINGCTVKFIKFFCKYDCSKCPEDKTSLWLTSTGKIKRCSFREDARPIENWQYKKMTKMLEDYIQKQ